MSVVLEMPQHACSMILFGMLSWERVGAGVLVPCEATQRQEGAGLCSWLSLHCSPAQLTPLVP